jgi:hypothetical protein
LISEITAFSVLELCPMICRKKKKFGSFSIIHYYFFCNYNYSGLVQKDDKKTSLKSH